MRQGDGISEYNQNTLQEPVSRHFLRDALRNQQVREELACRMVYISTTQKGASERAVLRGIPWVGRSSASSERQRAPISVTFWVTLSSWVITNNWQAVKPILVRIEPVEKEVLADCVTEGVAEVQEGGEGDDAVVEKEAAGTEIKQPL